MVTQSQSAIGRSNAVVSSQSEATVSLSDSAAAEAYVLNRLTHLLRYGKSLRPRAPLSAETREKHIEMLLKLWQSGCKNVADEDLFFDLCRRADRISQGGSTPRS